MHMMIGHTVYARDRSKTILTILNHAMASAGYQRIRKARRLLASYAIWKSRNGEVPLPSNMTKEAFTQAMVDNADYLDRSSLSGTEGKHYSNGALCQDNTSSKPAKKPPVSETGLNVSVPLLTEKLPCQVVPRHNKPAFRPNLPDNINLNL